MAGAVGGEFSAQSALDALLDKGCLVRLPGCGRITRYQISPATTARQSG